jgi:hypothetical protein
VRGERGEILSGFSCWEVRIGQEGTMLCKLSVLNYCLNILLCTVYRTHVWD